MRALLRALAVSGALVGVVAMAQSAQADAVAPAGAIVPASDVKKALAEIKMSWRTYDKCDQPKLCGTWFDSFGVGITFGDGSIAPFIRAQRLTASEHDCIVNARAALDRGDKGLAVQWVMAAKLQMSPNVRNWLGDHPDAVIAALHNCCY